MAREKTYGELAELRQREWNRAQARAAAALGDLHARLAKMPDVAAPPDQNKPFADPALICPRCSNGVFQVKRWVTVNGMRHRSELLCLSCRYEGTFDWNGDGWIG